MSAIRAGRRILNAVMDTGRDRTKRRRHIYPMAAVLATAVVMAIVALAATGAFALAVAITINGDAEYTSSRWVELSLDGEGFGAVEMCLSEDDVSWGAWESYADGYEYELLSSGDGLKYVYVKFRDGEGTESDSYSDSIYLDTAGPEGSITIEDDLALYATSTEVTLLLSADDFDGSGVAEMRFSEDGTSWSDDDWVAYDTSSGFTLSGPDGSHSVYAQFRDYAGNISDTYNDEITLDTAPPTGTIVINNDDASTTDPNVTLTLSASDDTSGVVEMRFSDDGDTWGPWKSYATSSSFTLYGSGEKTIWAEFQDAAGNISIPVSDSITLGEGSPDTTDPTVDITAPVDGSTLSDATPVLTYSASDNDSVASVTVTVDGSSVSTVSGEELPAMSDGSHTVVVTATDPASNSGSDSVTFTVDTTAPTGTITLDGGSSKTFMNPVPVAVSASGDTSEMRFGLDNENWSDWEAYATSTGYLLPADGPHTVYAQFKDAAGNVSSDEISDSITLDTTGPSGTVTINGGAAYTKSRDVTLTISATDTYSSTTDLNLSNDGVNWNGWVDVTTLGSSDGPWTVSWTLPDSDGSHTVYAKFIDNLANYGPVAQSDPIILDRISPSVYVSPLAPEFKSSIDVEIGSDDGTAALYYSTDGSDPIGLGTLYTGPITLTTTTTLKYVAIDLAGNASTVGTYTYTLDNVGPEVIISSPADGSFINDNTPLLSYTSGDAENSGAELDGAYGDDVQNGQDLPELADGEHTVTVHAWDFAGNETTVTSTFTVDTIAPAVSADPTGGDFGPSIDVTLTATEAAAKIYYTLDGLTEPTDTSTHYTAPIHLTTATTLKFVAIDPAGNTSLVGTETYTFSVAPAPTVTINQAAGQADPTSDSPIDFTAVFSEPVTGFTSGDVTLGGSAGATTAVVTEIGPKDGTTYNVAVSGMTKSGTVTASIPAGVAEDVTGNVNEASTSTDATVQYNKVAGETPPEITVPADMTVEATSPFGAYVYFTPYVKAVEPVNGGVLWWSVPSSGSLFPLDQTTIVTVYARDRAGHTASTTFAITVVDTTAPQIVAKSDYMVPAFGLAGAQVTAGLLGIRATDIVDGLVDVVCAPALPAILPFGQTVLTLTATDAHGNTATASTVVTVGHFWRRWR